jgi:hypothetical protein
MLFLLTMQTMRFIRTFSVLIILLIALPLQALASGDTVAGYVPQVPEGFATQWDQNADIYYSSGGANSTAEVAADTDIAYGTVTRFFSQSPGRVKVIIGSSQQEYENIMGVGTLPDYSMGTGWGDGDTGTIVIKSPDQVPDFQTVMTHELTHIAMRDYIFGYKYAVPEWFSEGLATYVSGDLPADKRRMINDSCREGSLMSIDSLNNVLQTSTADDASINDVGLAYTQSGLIVEYIGNTYGNATILRIMNAFGPSGNMNSAFMAVLGKTQQQVDDEWQAQLKGELDRVDGKILEQTVDGYIVNQHGTPMPNETVAFTALRNDSIVQGTVYKAMTDNSGYYKLNVTYGQLLVVSDKAEYEGFNQTITLGRNEVRSMNVTLNGTALELRLAAEAKATQDRNNKMYLILGTFNVIAITACVAIVLRRKR